MPVYIEKGGDLVGCHHSGTTNKQGKIGLKESERAFQIFLSETNEP